MASGVRPLRELPKIHTEAPPEVAATRTNTIRSTLLRLIPAIDRDFSVQRAPPLSVQTFATHAEFGRALDRIEGVWPESQQDDLGNIVHGTLPIGPFTPDLAYSLVHVYTEWILDRELANSTDRQPAPAWLYDGIAEYEADRHATHAPCQLHGAFPIPLTRLSSPANWWHTRAGPFSSLEYCEADAAARAIIRRVGWARFVRLIHSSQSWSRFAQAVSHEL